MGPLGDDDRHGAGDGHLDAVDCADAGAPAATEGPTHTVHPVPERADVSDGHDDLGTPSSVELAESSEVLERLERLDERLDRLAEAAVVRESLLERFHLELQELRRGEIRTALRPIVMDLMKLCTAVDEAARHRASKGDDSTASLLSFYTQQIEATLRRCGVESITAAPGDAFDAEVHEVAELIDTDDPDLGERIHEMSGRGFRDTEKDQVLKAVSCGVYRFIPRNEASEHTHEMEGPVGP